MVVISQETFEEAVRENMDLLGLTPEEAVKETVIQFESQGVDLNSVNIQFISAPISMEHIEEEVKTLEKLNSSKSNSMNEIIKQLEAIKIECEKGIPQKVAAGKSGAYDAILDTLQSNKEDVNIVKGCLRALVALMSKQPDLLNERGIEVIISNLKKGVDFDIKKLTLRWTKECCVMHEMNRQNIFKAHILDNLKELLSDGSSEILKEVLAVCRALVLDDDVRVEFGNAHEHARIIASETLCCLVGLLVRFQLDEALMNDLILTISALMVRTEFCKKVEDAGGLEMIRDVMQGFPDSEKINRQCFKLIKSLAGNDDCKAHMVQKGLAPVIVAALETNKGNMSTAVAGLGCISALTLRSSDNSKVFFEAGVPAVIVEIMKLYRNEKQIQKFASWAVRNMVSRSKYQCSTFLDLGIEEILQEDLKIFKDIEYDIKAALRDLGAKVQLKEEWTGKGGALTTGLSRK
ncbi:armadillo repeat-containing protein 6 homolog [Leptinotarsa decemlineata]|uniref:armadillo repeat-containing protein 6 homolog n=1 Tax=Leptinotarsa decemlineata TaxID=7539 RepID=UPI003D308E9E